MPTYDGSTDPQLWLKEYELTANANGWDDDTKVKCLVASLTNAPKLYIMREIERNPYLKWPIFMTGFIRAFTNTFDNFNPIAEVINKRQKHNESLDDYWFGKLALIEMKCSDLAFEHKKDLLMNGLNQTLKAKVEDALITTKVTDLEQLGELVKKFNNLITTKPISIQYPRNYTSYDKQVYHKPDKGRQDGYGRKDNGGSRHRMDRDAEIQQLKDTVDEMKKHIMGQTGRNPDNNDESDEDDDDDF